MLNQRFIIFILHFLKSKLSILKFDKQLEDIQYYKEQLSSLKDIFARTTDYMNKLQRELNESKRLTDATNESLNQSISYAKKIQNHLIPNQRNLCIFEEVHFDVIQRDIIGGDFIYITEIKDTFFFCLMDCTGHGIPGALLTMMGYNFLSEIILSNPELTPDEILSALNIKIQRFFSQNKSETSINNGMDGVLCSYNVKTNKLQYSMAGRPFWAKINGNWMKHRPKRNPIGEINDHTYDLYELNINKGDEIFLFSDGLTDQFGGEKNKKFMTKNLFNHLDENNFLSLESKVNSLIDKLKAWQGNEEQTDDISYIAIKF